MGFPSAERQASRLREAHVLLVAKSRSGLRMGNAGGPHRKGAAIAQNHRPSNSRCLKIGGYVPFAEGGSHEIGGVVGGGKKKGGDAGAPPPSNSA